MSAVISAFKLKCPVCGTKEERTAEECKARYEGDYPACKKCYGIPMMVDQVMTRKVKTA